MTDKQYKTDYESWQTLESPEVDAEEYTPEIADMSIEDVHKQFLSSSNIAKFLNEEWLDECGTYLHEKVLQDIISRSEYDENNQGWMELALQVQEEKSWPWENSSNVKHPMLIFAAMQFNARSYPALVSGPDLAKAVVTGYDPDGEKSKRAKRVGKHLSAQILHHMDEWEDEMDRLLFCTPLVGTQFKKVYHDSIYEKHRSEVVSLDAIAINYDAKSLKTARITHILSYSPNDVEEFVREGIWLKCALDGPTPTMDETSKVNEVRDAITGLSPSPITDDSPSTYYEIFDILDLDNDGYAEPYVITLRESDKKVVRIVPNYGIKEVKYGVDDDGDTIVKRVDRLESWVRYGFIPNPHSNIYDLGFGHLLGPLTESTNTLINQLVDAGTLSNLQSGFITRGSRMMTGDMHFEPGEWKVFPQGGDDLRKHILPLPVREPSNVLFQLLGMLVGQGERLTSTMDIMAGEMPGQNTKATVVLQAVEQGSKVFNAIHKRIYKAFSRELKILFRLNKDWLSDQDYQLILDEKVAAGMNRAKDDYNMKDMDIVPSADPTVSSTTQRMAKLEVVGNLMAQGTINSMEYTKRTLEAIEEPNPELLMEQPPSPPDPKMEEIKLKREQMEKDYEIEMRKLMQRDQEIAGQIIVNEAQAIKAVAEAGKLEEEYALKWTKQRADELKQFNETILKQYELNLNYKQAVREDAERQESKPSE